MSGALSAFLRGAAGPGLIDWTNNQRRQDEMEAQRQQHDEKIKASAAERERDRRERNEARERELRMNLDARYGPADLETGARAGGGALRRAGGGGAGDGGNDDQNIIGEVMARTGMGEAEVRQRMAQGQGGFTRKTQQVEQFDDGDGRMRNATKEVEEPDVKAYMEFSRTLGAAMTRSGGNPQQRATARQTDFETESGRAAQQPGADVGGLATGVAVAGGKPLYDNGDSKYTPATGALTQAKVGKLLVAQGGGSGGGTKGSASVQRVITNENGDAVAVMRDGSTRDLGIRSMDFNKQVAGVIAKMTKEGDIGFADLPIEVQRARAMEVLGVKPKPKADAAPAAPAAAPSSAPPAPPDASQRKPGTVYQTPRGPMKWTGTGWLKA